MKRIISSAVIAWLFLTLPSTWCPLKSRLACRTKRILQRLCLDVLYEIVARRYLRIMRQSSIARAIFLHCSLTGTNTVLSQGQLETCPPTMRRSSSHSWRKSNFRHRTPLRTCTSKRPQWWGCEGKESGEAKSLLGLASEQVRLGVGGAGGRGKYQRVSKNTRKIS